MTTTRKVTTEDARCSLAISKCPDAYLQGRNDFAEGLPCECPYPHGSKLNNFKRVAWYSGYMDVWREGREAYYDSLKV